MKSSRPHLLLVVMALFASAATTGIAQEAIPHWQIVIDSGSNSRTSWMQPAVADSKHFAVAGIQWSPEFDLVVLQTSDAGVSWKPVFTDRGRDSVAIRAVAYPTPDLLLILADSTFSKGFSG